MKFCKRMIVIMLLFGLLCCPLKASAISYASAVAVSNQQEVDALLTELNKLAAEKRVLSAAEQMGLSTVGIDSTWLLASVNNRQAEVLDQLEQHGAHTIDSKNAEDIAQLAEVVLCNANGKATRGTPEPPDLEAIADCYTVTRYNGSTYISGVKYDFVTIYVTDNKDYSRSPLTASEDDIELVGKESTVLADLLDYQFSFGLSQYLGAIPGGWLVDWTIGAVYTALNSLNENSTITYRNNSDIYNMIMLSVTQMMYCYVYIPNADWELCGVCASNIEYTRTESFAANIQGTPYSWSQNYPNVTSNTGRSAASYITNMVRGNGCIFDRIGSISVNTYSGKTVRFRPGFADYPADLN